MKQPQLGAVSRDIASLAGVFALSLLAPSPALAACPCNTVQSGPLCVDKYEASIWETKDPKLIEQIKQGTVCSPPKGANQKGVLGFDYSLPCTDNGGKCTVIFALSLPKLNPAEATNWFIAAAACRNSGKRLLTNGEWQAAALGTPDPGKVDTPPQCNIGTSVALTGTRSNCFSDVGAYDMAGNVAEWVQDWGSVAVTGATNWGVWSPNFGNDRVQIGGSPIPPGQQPPTPFKDQWLLPGATLRGGSYAPGSAGNLEGAGVYAIDQNGSVASYGSSKGVGFRCGK